MIDFENMNYVQFISFIRETNRCPGGKDTIGWILHNSFATKSTKVLEIGSNTGFSSLEIARTMQCSTLGIDPVAEAVEASREELKRDTPEIQGLVRFEVGSAYDIPCTDNSIDLIVAGGSTSFMDDKQTAISEMKRVLRPWGFLSVTNLFYHTPPPQPVLDAVSSVIGITIKPMTAEDWVNTYTNLGDFELYKYERAKLSSRTSEEIDTYIDYFMHKPHITKLSEQERQALRQKWGQIIGVFNENHKYLGFIKAILRKRTVEEEPELFKLPMEAI